MAITSEEVNYLIYRYLQESGFSHSAFCFAHESLLTRSSVVQTDVPPGTLVAFLQKGLQYIQIEQQIDADGYQGHLEVEATLLAPRAQLAKSMPPRQDASSKHERRKAAQVEAEVAAGVSEEAVSAKAEEVAQKAPKDESMEVDGVADEGFASEAVVVLPSHSKSVLHAPWSPKDDLLCTGGAHAEAVLWDLGNYPEIGDFNRLEVPEDPATAVSASRDVTALQWSPDGEHMAAGCYDGSGGIWHRNGQLVHNLHAHRGPIFCLRWNRDGTRVLTGSYDKSAVLWDTATGNMLQMLQHHSGPVLDADWRSDDKFATCGSDRSVLVFSLGRSAPDAKFSGHQDEVNALRWKPADAVLASCSDDRTVKVWSLSQSHCLADLRGHSGEVYTLQWGPPESNARHLLATASFDTTVKLWDVEKQEITYNLARHQGALSTVAFSPNGEYLASGGLDNYVYLWSVKDGTVVKSYKGDGDIYSVAWSSSGGMLSVCSGQGSPAVLDCRR